MLKNKKGVISIDIKKIIKGKRNLLVGGVLIVATIALTSCSDADIQIRTYDKGNDDTSHKISNVVDYAINEFTSENSSSKTSNDTTTNNTESTGNNGTTKTASEEEIKQARRR